MLKRVSMGHQNILTLVDYFETMNNCMLVYLLVDSLAGTDVDVCLFSYLQCTWSPT